MLISFYQLLCAQQSFLSLIERWKNNLDQSGYGGAILMDLSKAFDIINHDLLIAKLGAYGFDTACLKLIRSYLASHFHRTKVNTSFKIVFRSTSRICPETTFVQYL